MNKEEDLAEISRRANVPVSFQPAFTNRVPEDTEMLSGFAETGARVYAQVSPRNFDLAIRLKHQSMILFGMPSWMAVMNLPPEERLEQFADPDRRPGLVEAFNDRPLDAITVKQTAHPANGRYGRRGPPRPACRPGPRTRTTTRETEAIPTATSSATPTDTSMATP